MLIVYQHAYTTAVGESAEPVGYVLKRAQAALRRSMDEALGDHDLTMAQYAVLRSLNQDGPLTNAALARRSFVTPQTSIRIVSDLEDAGYVVRHPDPQNSRRLNVTLTRAGSTRLASADGAVNDVERRMLNGFSATDRRHFRTLLERSTHNLETQANQC